MEHNELKTALLSCPDLSGLDESSVALLLWRAQQLNLKAGAVVYDEGASFDDSFCLLMEGWLSVERDGVALGDISDRQIFGEMAYFTSLRARTATVRVGSQEAVVLKFQLTADELASPPFAGLKRYLGLQAWDRFVSNSQNLPFVPTPPASDTTQLRPPKF